MATSPLLVDRSASQNCSSTCLVCSESEAKEEDDSRKRERLSNAKTSCQLLN